jgi:hypothetical protein
MSSVHLFSAPSLADLKVDPYASCSGTDLPVTTEAQISFLVNRFNELDRYAKQFFFRNADLLTTAALKEQGMQVLYRISKAIMDFLEFVESAMCVTSI